MSTEKIFLIWSAVMAWTLFRTIMTIIYNKVSGIPTPPSPHISTTILLLLINIAGLWIFIWVLGDIITNH